MNRRGALLWCASFFSHFVMCNLLLQIFLHVKKALDIHISSCDDFLPAIIFRLLLKHNGMFPVF